MNKCEICGSINLAAYPDDSYVCKDCLYDSLTGITVTEGWNNLRPMIEALLADGINRGALTQEEANEIINSEANGIYNWVRKGIKKQNKKV